MKSKESALKEIIMQNESLVEYEDRLEKAITEAKRQSGFEYKVTSTAIVNKDRHLYEASKASCPNREVKMLFHGSGLDAISSITVGGFLNGSACAYGIGTYFSDSLDCARIYSKASSSVGSTFQFVGVEVYYDRTKATQNGLSSHFGDLSKLSDDEIKRKYPDKVVKENGLNTTRDYLDGVNANYYVVFEKKQILPLFAITAQRNEYCVIWRDPNLMKENEFTNHNNKLRFLIAEKLKCNTYFASTTEEALELIERKKKNKIILISNIGPDRGGKEFVERARKAIKSDVAVLFSSYEVGHLNWLRSFPNALFTNYQPFFEKYISNFTVDGLNALKGEIEAHYNTRFPGFTSDLLSFPCFCN